METARNENNQQFIDIATGALKICATVTVKIICALLYLLLSPVALIVSLIFYLYRELIKILARCFKPEFMEIMSSRDAVVGLDDVTKNCQCALTVCMTLQGDPSLEFFRSYFSKHVINSVGSDGNHSYSKLLCFYETWMGFAFWRKEEDFKIENHVKFCDEAEQLLASKDSQQYPQSDYENNNLLSDLNQKMSLNLKDVGDKTTATGCGRRTIINEDDLLDILSKLATKPFEKGLSPWEMLIIRSYVPSKSSLLGVSNPSYNGDESCQSKDKPYSVAIFRIHHALGDGYSIMKLLVTNMSGQKLFDSKQLESIKARTPSFHAMILNAIFLTPYYHFKQFVLNVDRNIWHISENKLKKKSSVGISEKIPLSILKRIASKHNVSVTSVLLTVLGGAINKILSKSFREKKIPNIMRAMSPMPWKNHPMDKLVNHWTLGIMTVPIKGKDSVEKLQLANHSVQKLRSTTILLSNFGTVPLLLGAPSFLSDFWGTNWMTTLVLSNFPGPMNTVNAFSSHEVSDVIFFLPQMRGNASVGVAFLSYKGSIRVTLQVDEAILDASATKELSRLIGEEVLNLDKLPPSAIQVV